MQAILRDNTLSGMMPIEITVEKEDDSLVLHWESIKADIVLPIDAVRATLAEDDGR